MRNAKFAFLAIALLMVFSAGAHALALGLPGTVEFHGVPVELSFVVQNSENVSRPLEVRVFLPVEYQFEQKPGTVKAGGAAIVKLKLFPRPELIGSRYTGTIAASMGIAEAEKNFSLVFLPQNSCPVLIVSKAAEQERNGQKIFLVSSRIVNETKEEQRISLEAINGIPADWKIDAEPLEKIGPEEQLVHTITLLPAEAFDGAIELVYRCGEFTEKKSVKIVFAGQKDFLAGFASLFSFDFASGELVLNALLILIAAVLLIAFISRMVRKVSAGREVQAAEMNGFETSPMEEPEIVSGKPSRKLSEIKKQVMKKTNGKK